MCYIENNLLRNERLIYKARLHWIIFLMPAISVTIGIFLTGIFPSLAIFMVVAGLVFLIDPFIRYITSEFGVTNKRIILKVGLIRRQTFELLHKHVESLSVKQSVLGRILGFGSVTVTGTGGIKQIFYNISSPLKFRKRVHEQIS